MFGRKIAQIHTPGPSISNSHFYPLPHTRRPPTHVSWGLFVQSIPAWRFPRHIKEPPPAGQAVPPQHASVGPGEGVLFALSHLFWFYSQYPIAAASAELWVCCCTVCMSFWSAGKAGELPLRDSVIRLCAASTSLQQWQQRLTGSYLDASNCYIWIKKLFYDHNNH